MYKYILGFLNKMTWPSAHGEAITAAIPGAGNEQINGPQGQRFPLTSVTVASAPQVFRLVVCTLPPDPPK